MLECAAALSKALTLLWGLCRAPKPALPRDWLWDSPTQPELQSRDCSVCLKPADSLADPLVCQADAQNSLKFLLKLGRERN